MKLREIACSFPQRHSSRVRVLCARRAVCTGPEGQSTQGTLFTLRHTQEAALTGTRADSPLAATGIPAPPGSRHSCRSLARTGRQTPHRAFPKQHTCQTVRQHRRHSQHSHPPHASQSAAPREYPGHSTTSACRLVFTRQAAFQLPLSGWKSAFPNRCCLPLAMPGSPATPRNTLVSLSVSNHAGKLYE